MNKTFKYIIVLAAVIIGSTSASARLRNSGVVNTDVTGGTVAIKYQAGEGDPVAVTPGTTVVPEGATVTVRLIADGIHTFTGATVTAVTAGSTDEAQARSLTRRGSEGPGIGGTEIDVNAINELGSCTFTMPEAFDVALTVRFAEKPMSTATLSYIDADGTTKQKAAGTVYVLDGTESILGIPGTSATDMTDVWYVCQTSATANNGAGLAYDNPYADQTVLTCTGNCHVHLILKDGSKMTVEKSIRGIFDDGKGAALSIYAQSEGNGMGELAISGGPAIEMTSGITINGGKVSAIRSFQGLCVNYGDIAIHGGEVTCTRSDGANSSSIYANEGDITITGGTVSTDRAIFCMVDDDTGGNLTITGGEVKVNTSGIKGYSVTITGGKVEAPEISHLSSDKNITLGWTNATDYIKVNTYTGTVKIVEGQRFIAYNTENSQGAGGFDPEETTREASAILTNSIDNETIAQKILRPLAYVEPDGNGGTTLSPGYLLGIEPGNVTPVGRTDNQGQAAPDFTITTGSDENQTTTSFYIYKAGSAGETIPLSVPNYGQKYAEFTLKTIDGTPISDPTDAVVTIADGDATAALSWEGEQDIFINSACYYNTGVNYLYRDDMEQKLVEGITPTSGSTPTKVYILDGTETILGKAPTDLTERWYVALPAADNDGYALDGYGELTVSGVVNLILADGSKMKATGSNGIIVDMGSELNIYGQSGQSGSLTAEATSDEGYGIKVKEGTLRISGGCVSAKAPISTNGINMISSNFIVNGGKIFDIPKIYISGGLAIINGGELISLKEFSSPSQETNSFTYVSDIEIEGGDITVTDGSLTGYQLTATKKDEDGGNMRIFGGTFDCATRIIGGEASTTVSGGKIMVGTLGWSDSQTSLSLKEADDYINSGVYAGTVTIPQGSYLGNGEKVYGLADGDYVFGEENNATTGDVKNKSLVKAISVTASGSNHYMAYGSVDGAWLLSDLVEVLYPVGVRFVEQAGGSYAAGVVLSDQPLAGIPKGGAVILASKTDGGGLGSVWLMGSNVASGEGKTPVALAESYEGRTDRLANFVATDGTKSMADLIAEAIGATTITDQETRQYMVFVLSGDRFVAASFDANKVPDSGLCLLVVPMWNLLRHLNMGHTASGARVVSLAGSEGSASAIKGVKELSGASNDTYFGLDGRRLSGKPAQKGVYINNGKKTVIR